MQLPGSTWLSAALLLLIAGPVCASTERDAQSWLEAMSQAVRTLNYEGIFVYRYRGNLESMRILHRVQDGAEEERLFALNGTPREVIRKGEEVTCILPDTESVLVDRRRTGNPLSEVVPMNIEALRDSYSFAIRGTGRVAGRTAKRVAIEPRDGFRYGYRLWIDTESKLLLRADLMGEEGTPIEQLMFTQIELREQMPDAAFEQTVNGPDYTWYRDEQSAEPATGESDWQVTKLPPGFVLESREWRVGSKERGSAEHYLYSDGLASVSVYIEPPTEDDGFVGISAMGAVSAFGRVLNGHQAIVVGEVPTATVEMIGRGIKPGSASEQ